MTQEIELDTSIEFDSLCAEIKEFLNGDILADDMPTGSRTMNVSCRKPQAPKFKAGALAW